MFGVGTLTLYSADQSHRTFEVTNIKKPEAVRKFLSKIVEQERTTKGITGREIYGAAGMIDSSSQEYDFIDYDFIDVDGDGIPD